MLPNMGRLGGEENYILGVWLANTPRNQVNAGSDVLERSSDSGTTTEGKKFLRDAVLEMRNNL